MIPLRLPDIAKVVGGTIEGSQQVTVTAPAVHDSRQADPGGLFVALAGVHVDGHDYAAEAARAGAVAVLGTRPTALPTVVVEDGTIALQTLATHVVAQRRAELTILGVTGSQGKTSTKDMLAAVLSATAPTIATAGNLNNELGVPITMLRVESNTRFLVLEMGAGRIGDIAKLTGLVSPDVAVVLSVGHAHIGEFGSRNAIAQGKSELVRGMAPSGTAVLNADDSRVTAMRSLTTGPVVSFGRTEHADVRVLNLELDHLGRPSFMLRTSEGTLSVSLPLIGAYQAVNAAAAVAAAMATGVSFDAAAEALATTTLSTWRMEVRHLTCGATLLNDSYNASPDANRAALDTLAAVKGRRHIAVLGEMLELGPDSEAEHYAIGKYAASRAEMVLAVGAGARAVATGAGDWAVALVDNEATIEWLRKHLIPGDVVLIKASRGAHLDEVADALA